MSDKRLVQLPWRRNPKPLEDKNLPFERGAVVDVLIDCGAGIRRRLRGIVVRAAGSGRARFELAPLGVSAVVEIELESVVTVVRFTNARGSQQWKQVEQLQSTQWARRRSR